jgi:hypothetical protein
MNSLLSYLNLSFGNHVRAERESIRACATLALDTSTARLHNAAETTGTPPSGFTVGL